MSGGGASLPEVDRRRYRRLQGLARQPATSVEPIAVRDLAFVLHDVLMDGFRAGREVHGRHEEAWASVEPQVGEALARPAFDRQLFLLGAYATITGIELALDDPDRSLLVEQFRAAAKGTFRLQRSRPGRWHIDRAVARYREAAPADGGSFLHTAAVFTAECADVAVRADEVASAADVLGEVALDTFYEAAAGTVTAVRGWQILP